MKTKISVVSVMMLVVCFMPLKNSGQDTLTNGEVYDFEVGDIFHYSIEAHAPGSGLNKKTNVEIIDKYYSIENDTLYYVKHVIFEESGFEIPYHIGESIETDFICNLNLTLPSIDSIYSDPSIYNGRLVNYDNDTGFSLISVTHLYIAGCGPGYYNFSDFEGNAEWTENLIYYNKSGEEWGEPYYVSIDEKFSMENVFFIFPNPATSFITIHIKEGLAIEEAIIYNHLGQKALEAVPVNNTVDVSGLTPGIYFIEVSTKDWRGRTKLIIKN